MAIITLQSTHTPSGKSRLINLTTIAAPQPGDWPDNEPANFDPIAFIDGSTLSPAGWNPFAGWGTDPDRQAIVVDPASKHGTVIEKRFKVGDTSGWNGGLIVHPSTVGYRELFARMVFEYHPDWDFHSAGDKLWLPNVGSQGRTGIGAYTRNGRLFTSGALLGESPVNKYWYPILNGSSTITQGGALLDLPLKVITRAAYHTVEIHRVASIGGPTGSFRLWVDNEEFTRFFILGSGDMLDVAAVGREWANSVTGQALADPLLSTRIELPLYWGGQGDTKKKNDWFRLSEFYLSGRR